MPAVAETIERKLREGLSAQDVSVRDESHLHAGHAGAPEGGESHFRIVVVASAFAGLSLVARQRRVNDILREELAGPIHALAMKTLTPEEAASAKA
ncbi:MAG: BolA family protein [Pseudomonadota bacterium]